MLPTIDWLQTLNWHSPALLPDPLSILQASSIPVKNTLPRPYRVLDYPRRRWSRMNEQRDLR